MATNGESARRWLSDNKQKVSEARVRQIRDSLEQKANQLSNTEQDDLDDEYQGILEALEVMDVFISEQYETKVIEPMILDASPLVAEDLSDVPVLNVREKQARFQALLKESKL